MSQCPIIRLGEGGSVMGKKVDGGRGFRGGGDEKPKGSNLIIMASV